MMLFRMFLIVIFGAIALYTAPVIANYGVNLLPIFFGDIAKVGWPGQFNLDFLGFLLLSAFWTAWRNEYSAAGLGLCVLAFFLGAPFLTLYLLFLSYQTKGNVAVMLMGARAV